MRANEAARQKIQSDTEAFLASGGTINLIPFGIATEGRKKLRTGSKGTPVYADKDHARRQQNFNLKGVK